MKKNTFITFFCTLIVLAVTVTFIYIGSLSQVTGEHLQSSLHKSYLMQQEGKLGKTIPPATLLNHEGHHIDTASYFNNQWSLVFFGFTHCPDICITEMHLLSKILHALKKAEFSPLPKVYLVSVDPMRDKADKLNAYVKHFNPDFNGLTGEAVELSRFMKPFGAYYEFSFEQDGEYQHVDHWNDIPQPSKESYTVNHTAWSYLINPEGKLVAAFPTPHDGELLLQDIKLLLGNLS